MKSIVVLALLLVACGPSAPVVAPPAPAPNQDPEVPPPLAPVAPTSGDEKACLHLRDLKCPDGVDAPCLRTFQHARTNESAANAGETDKASACIAGAVDAAAVRACGGPSTVTFTCAP